MKTKSRIILILSISIVLLTVQKVFPQPPEIAWDRTYGGDSNDVAYSVQQTIDGGYVFGGYTGSFGHGNKDSYLVKTNSLGDTLWTHQYGGIADDESYCVQQTLDGGYVLFGNTLSFGDGIYLVKTDNQGDTLWTRTYRGTYIVSASSGQQITDTGYIIAGYVRSSSTALREMYLMKTDSTGDTLWTHSYGGSDHRGAYDVHQTVDGGYIVVGCNPFYGAIEIDIYLVKTDSLGDTLWTRTFGGPGEEYALSVQQTGDGGYIIAGTVEYTVADILVIKTDSMGDTLWTRTYGGPIGETASSIRQTHDGGYIIAGMTSSFGAINGDMYLVRIDAQGDTLWTLVYGGPDYELVASLNLCNDGGYIIAGGIMGEDYADAWLVKTGPDTSTTHAPSIEWVSHPTKFTLHPAYPNPFNPSTRLTFDIPIASQVNLSIYDILGRQVTTLINGWQNPGTHEIMFSGSNLSSGIYFYRLQAGDFNAIQKMVLVK
jgi:hypothetical protein